MHIAHFTNTYYPVISGVVRSVSAFRQALVKLGHNVFVFAQEDNGVEDPEPFIFRYPSINVPLAGDFPAVIPISSFIDQLLPSLKLDVIHSHHPILLGQAAAKKANDHNLPLIFTFHTQYREYSHYFPMPQEIVQDFLREAIDHWLMEYMKKCQHIIVPTESMRRLLAKDYGLHSHVTVIPTGIDLEPFKKVDGEEIRASQDWDDDIVMITVGRLAPEKNFETLIRAGALAIKKQPKLRLVIIGDGPDRDDLEELARDLEIASRVDFLGKVSFDEVPAYLKAADFFGFASVSETQGLVSLEALAAGLPVVAVDATGTRDVIKDGAVGLLTENTPEALAGGIIRLLEDPDLMRRFRSQTMETAASFDILRQARRLVDVYHQAIETKRAGQHVRLEKVDLVYK
jgi:1,2-diacylglycerol 3-alpha-glucosyltransferase